MTDPVHLELGPGALVGFSAALTIIGAIAAWTLRTVLEMRDEVRTVSQWAFGARGSNGTHALVQRHDAELRELTRRVDAIAPEAA